MKLGAHAKFRGDGLCGSGGRPPDIHTHTHTHFHLYIVDLLEILTIFFDKDSKAEKKSFNLNRLGLSKIPKRTNKGIIGGSSIVI